MEFKKVKLGEVIKVQIDNRGRNPEKYINYSKFPVIDNYLIKNEKYPNIKNVNRYIAEDTKNNFLRGHLEKDDVIITLVGNGIGNATMVPSSKCVIIQNTLGLRCNELMTNDFLYYTLISNRNKIVKYNRGSSQPSIRKTDLFSYEINVPTINYQNKITKILNSLDSKIEINNKIISNLESQAQAIFKSWFVDFEPFQDGEFVESELGMIPEGWEVRELKDVSKRINGFSYTSKDIFDESNINMITIKNFDRNGGLQNDSIKPISKNSRIKKDHYLKTNDILMACTDLTQKADIIGGVLLYFENENFDNEIFSMDLIKLVPFDKDDTFFFYYYLKNPIFKLFAENASSGTTVLHLSKKAVDNFNIVYPTKKHIDRFNDYVFPIIKKQRNLLTQNTKLAELRDALLPKLMAGEIDVSNIKIEGEEVKNE